MYTIDVTKPSIESRARVFTALGDPTRLRIVETLGTNAELSGSELAEELGISLALLCHHTKVMTEAQILKKRKDGQATYYSFDAELVRSTTEFATGRTRRSKPSRGR